MRRVWNVGLIALRHASSCASCSKALVNGVVCADCGKLQPASPKLNLFDYLGVEERYNNRVHPDRSTAESDEAKQLFEAHSSRLNSAYKILSDPVLRAEYMLDIKDIKRPPESNEFLMEMLELGEEIEQISDHTQLEEKRSALLDDVEMLKNEIADYFSNSRREDAANTLVRLRYFLRLLSNVNTRLGFDSK